MKRIVLFLTILFFQENLSAKLPDLIPYRKGNLWGYCDSTKKIVIPCQFKSAPLFERDSVATIKDDKYVYVMRNGDLHYFVSPSPQSWTWNFGVIGVFGADYPCDKPYPYYDTITGKCGYRDCHNRQLIPNKYAQAGQFSEGIASVALNDSTWGCINTAGTLLFSKKCIEEIREFHSGTAIFTMKTTEFHTGGCGIIDLAGNILLPPIAYSLEDAGNCIIAQASDNLYFLLDRKGKMIYETPFDKLRLGDNKMILAYRFDHKVGFLDKNGKVVIPYTYQNGLPFSNGFAAVSIDGNWGFVNKNGKVVIPIKYQYPINSIQGFDNSGLCQMGNQGYIDIHGTEYWED